MPPIPIDIQPAGRISLVFPAQFDEKTLLMFLGRLERIFSDRDQAYLWVDLRHVPAGGAPFTPTIFAACIECANALRKVPNVRIAIVMPDRDAGQLPSILALLPLVAPMTVTDDANAAEAFLNNPK